MALYERTTLLYSIPHSESNSKRTRQQLAPGREIKTMGNSASFENDSDHDDGDDDDESVVSTATLSSCEDKKEKNDDLESTEEEEEDKSTNGGNDKVNIVREHHADQNKDDDHDDDDDDDVSFTTTKSEFEKEIDDDDGNKDASMPLSGAVVAMTPPRPPSIRRVHTKEKEAFSVNKKNKPKEKMVSSAASLMENNTEIDDSIQNNAKDAYGHDGDDKSSREHRQNQKMVIRQQHGHNKNNKKKPLASVMLSTRKSNDLASTALPLAKHMPFVSPTPQKYHLAEQETQPSWETRHRSDGVIEWPPSSDDEDYTCYKLSPPPLYHPYIHKLTARSTKKDKTSHHVNQQSPHLVKSRTTKKDSPCTTSRTRKRRKIQKYIRNSART